MYYLEFRHTGGVMGPFETQMRARHLAARERLWPSQPGPTVPLHEPKNVLAAISALRDELAQLRALLEARGIIARPEIVPPVRLTCAVIRREVARFYQITLAELDARGGFAAALPRHVAMYLCKTLTRHSLAEIGRRFGGHHTTIFQAVRKIDRLRADDRKLDGDLCELRRRLTGEAQAKGEGT
jgi:hypothetical protein